MKIYDFPQRSPEWFEIRCGMPTASSFDKIIQMNGQPSKQRNKYLYKVAGEFVAKKAEESYQSAAMLRGCEVEAEARMFYEAVRDVEVQEVGFCVESGAGCSPDGFVGDNGLLEIKCPIISTQVGYLIDNKFPTDYFQQVQGQLYVTGRDWCDFLAYYPGLKPLLIRVERDESFISALRNELDRFCFDLKDIVQRIK